MIPMNIDDKLNFQELKYRVVNHYILKEMDGYDKIMVVSNFIGCQDLKSILDLIIFYEDVEGLRDIIGLIIKEN